MQLPEARRFRAVWVVYDDDILIPYTTNQAGVDDADLEQLDERLLTADDVAVWLAVPRSSVYEYARREHDPLPAVRIGRHLRFQRVEVADWITAQREVRRPVPPAPRPPVPPSGRPWWRTQTSQ